MCHFRIEKPNVPWITDIALKGVYFWKRFLYLFKASCSVL